MKVSIVIPAYNEATNLPATLRAVLAQDYPDFEVIVVNNASTDETPTVAGQFPVKVVHETRKGLLWARERGRQAASGEIIANLDADCQPEPDWLRRGVAHFRSDRVAAVSGPYDYHDGGVVFRRLSLLTQQSLYFLMSLVIQAPLIRRGAVMIGGNNLIRARVLEQAQGYNTAILFYGEDTDTAKRVVRYGRVVFSPRLTMKTSARRFRADGTIRLFARYLYYFFKTLFAAKKTPFATANGVKDNG